MEQNRDLIREITNSSSNHEKYMKTKFHSDDHLPLNETLKIYGTMILVRNVFYEGKYTAHKLSQINVYINQNAYSMIRFNYDKIVVSERIDVNNGFLSQKIILDLMFDISVRIKT